jgi:hypothetical protein
MDNLAQVLTPEKYCHLNGVENDVIYSTLISVCCKLQRTVCQPFKVAHMESGKAFNILLEKNSLEN